MSFFDDRIAPVTAASVRGQVIGYAQGAGLKITNWRIMSVGAQIFEAVTAALYAFTNIVPVYVRGFASLDTSFDPGDDDPYDPNNINMDPEPGFLSTYGKNTYGVERTEPGYATGFATFVNNGAGVRTIGPSGLIFTWTGGTPPTPPPTYTNTPDPAVYTNADGTRTVGVGESVTLPVRAQVRGSIASAPAGALSLTTTLVGCSATNAFAVLGNDREDAASYKTKCRQAPARLSFGGPGGAYEFLASKKIDGTPLFNAGTPPTQVAITRVQSTEESDTGIVTVHYASDSGGAIAEDVAAANANIRLNALAVPDCITFTGLAATPVAMHIVGTARIRQRPGVTAAVVAAAIVANLVKEFKAIPIAGVDRVSGAGVIYRADIQSMARAGFDGLYDVEILTPGSSTFALAEGQVATVNSVPGNGLGSGDWTITVVSS